MNRANQHALFQATNQSLLNIRQQEISYYTSLNAAFGTQAALIGGFTYGIFTQNVFSQLGVSTHIRECYFICASATIAASVHVILTAMLLQVLGPGLALHGPVGSMARACEGMREEQKSVIYGFAFMIFSFTLATLFLFWSVMTVPAAIASTIVWVISIRYYYVYCERIYLRFYWKIEGDYLTRDSEVDPSDQYTDEPGAGRNIAGGVPNNNPMHESAQQRAVTTGEDNTGINMTEKPANRRGSNFIGSMRLPFTSNKSPNHGNNSNSPSSRSTSPTRDITNNGDINVGGKDIVMQGFLLMKHPPTRSSTKTTWKRYYFTMNGRGHFFYYRNRQEYRERPQAPKRKRPLILSEFTVAVWNGDDMKDAMSNVKGSSMLFQFLLVPKDGEQTPQDLQEAMRSMMDSDMASVALDDNDDDSDDTSMPGSASAFNRRASTSPNPSSNSSSSRKWAMRCDTEEELQMWLEAMREISPTSFIE